MRRSRGRRLPPAAQPWPIAHNASGGGRDRPDDVPARLLRRLRDRRRQARTARSHTSAATPTTRSARGRLCRKCSQSATTARSSIRRRGCSDRFVRGGAKGAGALRGGVVGRGARPRRRPPRRDRRAPRRRDDPQHALHRHVLAVIALRLPDCASSTASVRPRSTRTRSATRRATSRSTTSTARRRRASTRAPRTMPPASSSGAPTPPPPRRTQHEHWLARSARGGSSSSTRSARTPPRAADLHLQPFPGSDAALAFALLHVDRPRRPGRPSVPARPHGRLGRARAAARRLHARLGRGRDRRPGGRLIEEAALLYGARPVAPVARTGPAAPARPAATSCAPAPCSPRSPETSAGPGTGFLYLNGTRPARDRLGYVTGAHLAVEPPPGSSARWTSRPASRIAARVTRARRLEHQHRRLEPRAGAAASRARARGPLHGRGRPLPDRHDRPRRRRPAGGELPRVRRPRLLVLRTSRCRRRSKATEPARRLAAEPGDLPAARRARWATTEPELFEPDADDHRRADAPDRPRARLRRACARRAPCRSRREPVVQFADLAFPTPSGRVEIASARAEADGHPPRPAAARRLPAGRGRLRLLSPASGWLLNDSFANDAKIARRIGAATVDAAPGSTRRTAGSPRATRSSSRTRPAACGSTVKLDPTCPRGVALSYKGRWPRLEPGGANGQRPESRREGRHGREHLGARHRGDGDEGLSQRRGRPRLYASTRSIDAPSARRRSSIRS